MMETGLSHKEVVAELRRYRNEDEKYELGRILSSVCTKPPYIAKQALMRSIDVNLGDASLFPGSIKIEREVIRMLGSLLSNPNAAGYIVSGGTEANTLAMWAARNWAREEVPEVVLPQSAHFSFDRAADMLKIKLVKTPVDEDHRANVKAIEGAISDRTVAIVGTAGTSDLGVVDPIPEMSELAVKHEVWLHVDAAFGGFVIPFLKELGYPCPEFDFKLPGVCSITIDPHKMGMAPIPSGGVLFRDASLWESISTEIPYASISGEKAVQATIIGTRPGSSVVAIWALLKRFGRRKYREIVGRCMELTYMLASRLRKMGGVELVVRPTMNIVGFKPKTMDVMTLIGRMGERGWKLTAYKGVLRVVVMPHLKKSHVNRFIGDLMEVLKAAR